MNVKIRGIYATALTKFFLKNKIPVVKPSEEIKERFKGERLFDIGEEPSLEIFDRKDRQGVIVKGEEEFIKELEKLMKESFFDVIIRKMENGISELEFPFETKSILDRLRDEVIPTLKNHHRLRIIDSSYVDLIERVQLSFHPEKKEKTSEEAERSLIWDKLKKGSIISLEHVKIDGRTFYLSEGEILEVDLKKRRLLLKRTKYKGRGQYDGLKIKKEEGDYGLTEIKEGEWILKHSYFRKEGELIGEYYNINTPIEVYPDRIRYVDLEIDVVRWRDGRVEILEEELLKESLRKGYLSERLVEKANFLAQRLKEELEEKRP